MARRGSSKRSAIAIQNGAKKKILNKGISLGKEENEKECIKKDCWLIDNDVCIIL